MTVSGHVETVQKWNERSEEPEEQDGTVPRPLSQQSEEFGGDCGATDGPPENGLYVLMYLYAGTFLTSTLRRPRQKIFEISAEIFEFQQKYSRFQQFFEIFGILLRKHHDSYADKKHSHRVSCIYSAMEPTLKREYELSEDRFTIERREKCVAVKKNAKIFSNLILGFKVTLYNAVLQNGCILQSQ